MYHSFKEILEKVDAEQISFWETVHREDCQEQGVDPDVSFAQVRKLYQAMRAADDDYDPALLSASGMVGGEGARMEAYIAGQNALLGDFAGMVCARALKYAASNACMKRIVAAPTAGSCGVLPAVLISMQDQFSLPEERLVEALFVAGGIGGVIAQRASLSGAAGGCQAEVGSAAAMAAGAAVYLRGGDAIQIADAAALALKNLLGLACDPVAGLVEVPCVKRNVIGAMDALSAADMALAGIHSVIPADEVVDAMQRVGKSLPEDIRETGAGGLAATPTGIHIREHLSALL